MFFPRIFLFKQCGVTLRKALRWFECPRRALEQTIKLLAHATRLLITSCVFASKTASTSYLFMIFFQSFLLGFLVREEQVFR